MKLLVFSLLLWAAWAQAEDPPGQVQFIASEVFKGPPAQVQLIEEEVDPPAQGQVIESEVIEYSANPPAQDPLIEKQVGEDPPEQDQILDNEVVEGSSEVLSDGDEKSSGYWETFNGRSFIFQTSFVSWAHAQQRCLSLGGNLATIHNYEENDFVKRLAQGREAWIGLSDAQENRYWFWINSRPLQYTNWCPGEPNNYKGQACAQINFSGSKCWDDLWCSHNRPFVCEK